jgi:hypothetical protein
MNLASGAYSLPWIPKRQDTLPIDGIFALSAGLSAFVLVLFAALSVIFLVQPEISPAIADGVGVGSARWSVLGQLDSPYSEGSKAASVPQTLDLNEAHARNMALTGQGWVGLIGGSSSADQPPDPVEAHARSLALTGQGWTGLVGNQSPAGSSQKTGATNSCSRRTLTEADLGSVRRPSPI